LSSSANIFKPTNRLEKKVTYVGHVGHASLATVGADTVCVVVGCMCLGA